MLPAAPGPAERLRPLGLTASATGSPEAVAEDIRRDISRWREMVEASGARKE